MQVTLSQNEWEKYRELVSKEADLKVILHELLNDIAKLEYEIEEKKKQTKETKLTIDEVREEIQRINDSIEKSENVSNNTIKIEWNKRWNNIKKTHQLLTIKGKCLTVREVAQGIVKYDSNGNSEKDEEDRLIRTLSSTLSTNSKKGRIFNRYRAYEGGDYLYGLKEWWKKDSNKPEEEYKAF